MKKAILIILCLCSCFSVYAGENDPRLFLKPDRVDYLRSAVKQEGTPIAEAFDNMIHVLDNEGLDYFVRKDTKPNKQYGRAYLMQCAGLAYQITGDKKYADMAFKAIQDLVERPDPSDRMPWAGYGLARATVCLGLGVAYDWCKGAWDHNQKAYVIKQIKRGLSAWPSFRHSNFGGQRGSNWVGVCRGAELIMIIGAGLEKEYSGRVSKLRSDLEKHINVAYDNIGYGQEGTGYITYGSIFTVPAAFALADAGDASLVNALKAKTIYKGFMFMASNQVLKNYDYKNKSIMTGVSHTNHNEEGYGAMIFNLVPESHLPYYKWFYDRYNGKLSQAPKMYRYEHNRQASMWFLLYYPENVSPQDPMKEFGPAMFGHGGLAVFRSKWDNADDILVSIDGDSHSHPKGWDSPTATQINIMGFNTRFAGGPGKQQSGSMFSCLLINGRHIDAKRGQKTTGKLTSHEKYASGGYAIVNGGSKYRQMGASKAERHLLADFSGEAAPGLISTLDDVTGGTPTWQLNLGDERGSDPAPKPESFTESGRSAFILKGEGDAYLKGWVLSPSNAKINAGDPFQVQGNSDGKIWIVMVIGKGKAPEAQISGEGMNSVIKIGKAEVKYDAGSNRIITSGKDKTIAIQAGQSTGVTDKGKSGKDKKKVNKPRISDSVLKKRLDNLLRSAKRYQDQGKKKDEIRLLKIAIKLGPDSEQAEYARKRIEELGE